MKSRLLKAQCGDCAYTVRVTRTWLCDAGPPLCPCNKQPMECPDWEELLEAEQEEAAQEGAPQVIRVSRVTVRKPIDCTSCGSRIQAGNPSRRTVYRLNGELLQADDCDACSDPNAARTYSGGTIGDERWRTALAVGGA